MKGTILADINHPLPECLQPRRLSRLLAQRFGMAPNATQPLLRRLTGRAPNHIPGFQGTSPDTLQHAGLAERGSNRRKAEGAGQLVRLSACLRYLSQSPTECSGTSPHPCPVCGEPFGVRGEVQQDRRSSFKLFEDLSLCPACRGSS
jgi:hypothetical protein